MALTPAHEQIIWSADVQDEETLHQKLDGLPDLMWVKLDRAFMLRHLLSGSDPHVIPRLREQGFEVFLDDKDSEVPHKLEDIVKAWGPERPTMLNCIVGGALSNGNMTPGQKDTDGLRRFADACHSFGIQPCGVVLLTSKAESTVRAEFGRGVLEQSFYYLDLMVAAGFTDVICSPKEVAAIKAESRFELLNLNCPGIQTAGMAGNDQARVMTPAEAKRAGADRLVIGRALTEGNPAENYRRIAEELEEVPS